MDKKTFFWFKEMAQAKVVAKDSAIPVSILRLGKSLKIGSSLLPPNHSWGNGY